jgi:ubiquinone/menaquinone biosynthesis C-methylase UbiE
LPKWIFYKGKKMPKHQLVPKNDFYAGFLYNTAFDPLTNHMRDLICAQVPENSHVLDVGCGTGHQLLKMASRIKAGVGVDLSDRMIACAHKQQSKKGVENLSFDLASAGDLSRFDDNQFELATITLVLHELEAELRLPTLKEMARVSKRLIITDYANSPSLFSLALMHLLEMTAGIFHYHLFRSYMSHDGAPGLFKRLGFRILREEKAMLGMVRVWVCEKE